MPQMSSSPKFETFMGLQALRFIAALLVVSAHATEMVAERLMGLGAGHFWPNGTAGVDIFFVISGFVMAVSAGSMTAKANAAREFLVRRIIRVVPMYWIATTLKIAMVLALPALALHTQLRPGHILSSYLFIPARNGEGEILPVLTVGWTLCFEMFFYALVALALFVRKNPLVLCGLAFGTLALIGSALPPDAPAILSFTRAIILEFIFGMLIAQYLPKVRMKPWLAALVLVIGVVAILTLDNHGRWRPFFWGIPAALIVGSVIQLEGVLGKCIPKWMIKQGDASYALYLFHPFLVPLVGVALAKLHLKGAFVPSLGVALCLVLSPIMAVIIHTMLGRPLTDFLRKRSKSAPVALPAESRA